MCVCPNLLLTEMEKTLRLSRIDYNDCFWLGPVFTRVYVCELVFVWVCNLWHWNMECALGRRSAGSSQDYDDCCGCICILGHGKRINPEKEREREIGDGDGEKWRKCVWRKVSWLKDNGEKKRLWRGRCTKERNKRERGQKGCVFVLDYFCGEASVWSSCGQWIILKFLRMSACQSPSAFSVSLCVGGTFMWRGKHITVTVAHSAWQTCEVLWVCTSHEKTDTLQQQSVGWDLAAIMLLHTSCSLCSSNPLPCPSAWQSHTHGGASHTVSTYMYVHQQITAQLMQRGLSQTEWKKQSQQKSEQLNISVCCHNCFCHYVMCIQTPSCSPFITQPQLWCQLYVWPQLSVITPLHLLHWG